MNEWNITKLYDNNHNRCKSIGEVFIIVNYMYVSNRWDFHLFLNTSRDGDCPYICSGIYHSTILEQHYCMLCPPPPTIVLVFGTNNWKYPAKWMVKWWWWWWWRWWWWWWWWWWCWWWYSLRCKQQAIQGKHNYAHVKRKILIIKCFKRM